MRPLHTVCETEGFRSDAAHIGMSDDEIFDLVDRLAENPDLGTKIPGTGGCRKIRVAKRDTGKSGGYRVITIFTGPDLPVFLLAVFDKTEWVNLSAAERNALADLTKQLIASYRGKVARLSGGTG